MGISLNQKTKEYLHIWEDDIRSACGFQAIMQYYAPHRVCIQWNIALWLSLCQKALFNFACQNFEGKIKVKYFQTSGALCE